MMMGFIWLSSTSSPLFSKNLQWNATVFICIKSKNILKWYSDVFHAIQICGLDIWMCRMLFGCVFLIFGCVTGVLSLISEYIMWYPDGLGESLYLVFECYSDAFGYASLDIRMTCFISEWIWWLSVCVLGHSNCMRIVCSVSFEYDSFECHTSECRSFSFINPNMKTCNLNIPPKHG